MVSRLSSDSFSHSPITNKGLNSVGSSTSSSQERLTSSEFSLRPERTLGFLIDQKLGLNVPVLPDLSEVVIHRDLKPILMSKVVIVLEVMNKIN